MKRIGIVTMAVVYLLVYQASFAEIRNGYEEKLILAEKSLSNLSKISKKGINQSLRKNLEKRWRATCKRTETLREYHWKTGETGMLQDGAAFL